MKNRRYIETGFRVKPKDRLAIRQVAHHVRDLAGPAYGFVLNGPFPVVGLVQAWHDLHDAGDANYPSYVLVEDPELPGRDAEYRAPSPDGAPLPMQNLFLFRRSIWAAAEKGEAVAREIIAHEIGHCVLEHPQPTYGRMYDDGRREPQADSEWQASVFMEELLMDSRLIRRGHGWGEIVSRFGVTPATAIARVRQLIDERRKSR